MTVPPPDGSRDRRIEDPTNLMVIHPAARAILPIALGRGVAANAVSVCGLLLGAGAAVCYSFWASPALVLIGLALSIGWLVADGLDGMIARATGTASAFGRFLDGVCDHGVFVLIYVAMAWSVGTAAGWTLAVVAGAAHTIQSSLYEGERARFHRRVKGMEATPGRGRTANRLVALYDAVAGLPDRSAAPFERWFAAAGDRPALARLYGERAAPTMKVMALLSANLRVIAIAVACLLSDPRLFWWFEIVPLTIVAVATIVHHRQVERSIAWPAQLLEREPVASMPSVREHRHS